MRPAHAELAKHYQLWALDHAAVGALFTEALADFLAGTRGQFEFELCGPGVMSMVNGVKAEDFPKFMAMTVRFAEALQSAIAAAPVQPPPIELASDPAAPVDAPEPGPEPEPGPPTPVVTPVPVPAPAPAPVPPAPTVPAPTPVPVGAATPEPSDQLPPPPASGADLPLPPAPPDAATAPLPPPPT